MALCLQSLALGKQSISICWVGESVNEWMHDYWKRLSGLSPQTLIHLSAAFRLTPGCRERTKLNDFLKLQLAFDLKNKLCIFIFALPGIRMALITPGKKAEWLPTPFKIKLQKFCPFSNLCFQLSSRKCKPFVITSCCHWR